MTRLPYTGIRPCILATLGLVMTRTRLLFIFSCVSSLGGPLAPLRPHLLTLGRTTTRDRARVRRVIHRAHLRLAHVTYPSRLLSQNYPRILTHRRQRTAHNPTAPSRVSARSWTTSIWEHCPLSLPIKQTRLLSPPQTSTRKSHTETVLMCPSLHVQSVHDHARAFSLLVHLP